MTRARVAIEQDRVSSDSWPKATVSECLLAGGIAPGPVGGLLPGTTLAFRNENNPFLDRRERTREWRRYAKIDCVENPTIKKMAESLKKNGLRKIDALHVACAIHAGCDYFITTDDKILNKAEAIKDIAIDDPIGFVKKELS